MYSIPTQKGKKIELKIFEVGKQKVQIEFRTIALN